MENKRNSKTITGLKAGKSSSELIYTSLLPAVDNFYYLGSTKFNWQDVFAYRGNFNDSVGVQGNLTVSQATTLQGPVVFGNSIVGNINVTNTVTAANINVTGTATFAAQPVFNRFETSGGNIFKDGVLVRGGVTIREGILVYDGFSANQSALFTGPIQTTSSANFEGYTYIKTPILKGDITAIEARKILMYTGNDSIIGPYLGTVGLKYYYRRNINEYYVYETSAGTPL